MSRFVHLHTHSHYSLLNALPRIPELVAAAKEYGMSALALTDNGNLYGAIEFYKECKKAEIKPILGVDFYIARRTRHDKEPGIDNKRFRVVLLAKNHDGYKNLIKLVTRSNLEGFYYKPRIDHELMALHSDNLICLIPSFSGETSALLKHGDTDGALEKLAMYTTMYGKENVYLEVSHHPEIDGHEELQEKIIAFGRMSTTPLVAAHEVYYLNPSDRAARDTLLSVAGSMGVREQGSLTSQAENFSFISPEDAEARFRSTPDALENSVSIAERCTIEFELGSWMFPNLPIPDGTTYDGELARLVEAGRKRRNLELTKEIQGRIEFELNVIRGKGFAPYFLVVADLLRYAHQKGILSTVRGSVAGSLVSYLLGITSINPLEYRLPFERFLNPERPSAPDIDMDFADNRRDEMIAYAREKYGEDNVAQIGTFGTMLARAAVRDTARALGYDYATGDRIAKLVPFGSQGFPMTIARAFKEVPELKELYATDEDSRRILDMAQKIEGCARHISVHAAGVVISPIPVDEIVPVQRDPKGEGKLITQYDMHAIEDVGLLKFDFLGLKNLAILADAVERVKDMHDSAIDLEKIPLDDEKTFALLAEGRTMGVFQMGGSGMTRYLRELKPSSIHDINAMVALYRPGPMESIPAYIERKHNPDRVTYLDPRMEHIVSRTYGVITYQDDVLLIARNLAGYSWLEADKLRKAMGKKIPAEMAAQKEKFIEGCVEREMTPAKAEQLWHLIEPFAAYGFNKAHAACYGRVAYETAYMKANYPVIYMAAVLSADAGDVEKIAEIIGECKRMDIAVLPPDINESFDTFTVTMDDGGKPEHIRFGLYSIKNFGNGVADTIIAERKKGGRFTSLANFLERVKNKNLNKKSLEALIKCGALDAFGERGAMLANLDELLAYSRAIGNAPEGQDSLFALMETTDSVPELTLEPAEPATLDERLAWEKEHLGLYVSGHPLDKHREALEKHDWDISRAKEELSPGHTTVIMGVIEEAKPIVTRSGGRMAFVRLSDFSGSIEVVVFPELFKKHESLVVNEKCIAVRGVLSDRGGEISLLAENMKALV